MPRRMQHRSGMMVWATAIAMPAILSVSGCGGGSIEPVPGRSTDAGTMNTPDPIIEPMTSAVSNPGPSLVV